MKKQPYVLFVPTLLDRAGTRHIIPAKDQPSYCGATGSQHFPHDYPAAELCQRCVIKHAEEMAKARMDKFFGGTP